MKLLSLSQADRAGVFFQPQAAFLDELAQYLAGKRVLEVFAGNGLLAAHLAERKVMVTATSLFSGMDCSINGLYHPVEELSAVDAAGKYRETHDVLLMSWPTVTDEAYWAARIMGKPVVIIGEYTDYAQSLLGGCATDEFWARATTVKVFSTYPGRRGEKAQVVDLSLQPKKSFHDARRSWEAAYQKQSY